MKNSTALLTSSAFLLALAPFYVSQRRALQEIAEAAALETRAALIEEASAKARYEQEGGGAIFKPLLDKNERLETPTKFPRGSLLLGSAHTG